MALLLCALLLLSLVGCLEKAEKGEGDVQPAVTEVPAEDDGAPEDTSAADALPAITLGDLTVTVGELRSLYNYWVELNSYYGLAAPSTAEEIKQIKDMGLEWLLSSKVLLWKAQQMGIELTEEKREQIDRQVEERINEYIAEFTDQAQNDLGEAATAAEVALKAREYLRKDVEEYFGYSFEKWVEEDVASGFRESAFSELLQEKFNESVTVTEEQAKAWFETELANQEESFTKDHTAFKSQVETYNLGETDVPALYTPEGFAQMQVITFDIDAKDSATFSANDVKMTNLEAEYGKLVLQGKDEDRQAEILKEYQELQTANDDLLKTAREKAEKAREDALNGMEFAQIFDTYFSQEGSMSFFGYAKDEPRQDGTVVFYTKEKDTEWPEEVWTVAKDMQEGEISELMLVGDSFYLIKRLADLPAGAKAFDEDAAAYTAAALAAKRIEEWEAIQEDWLQEARNAAVFYEDNYADVGVK